MNRYQARRSWAVAALAALAGCASGPVTDTSPRPVTTTEPVLVADRSGPPPANGIYMAGIVDVPPRLVARPRLVIPDSVTRRGIHGSVSVEYVVDTLGRVEPANFRVLSADHPALVGPAKAMVLGMRYRPGRVQGRAVRVMVGNRIRIGPGAR